MEYLKTQRRFAHVVKQGPEGEDVRRIQEMAARNMRRYGLVDPDLLDEDLRDSFMNAKADPEGRFDAAFAEMVRDSVGSVSTPASH